MRNAYLIRKAILVVAVVQLAGSQVSAAVTGALKAGAARVKITPDANLIPVPYTSILDPLNVRAIYLENGEDRAVLLNTDVRTIAKPITDRVSVEISRETDVPVTNILISASLRRMSQPLPGRSRTTIRRSLPSPLHFTLVLTCAATALRGFGDAGAALVGLTVGGRTDSDFEALGKRRGWRDQNRKLQWLRAVTNRARALHACMAGTDAFRPRWGFCFPIPQGGGPCSRFRVYFRRPPTRKGRRRCCRVTVELNFPPSLDSSAPFWYHRPASGLAGPR